MEKLTQNQKIVAALVAGVGAFVVYSLVTAKSAKAEENKKIEPAPPKPQIPSGPASPEAFGTGLTTRQVQVFLTNFAEQAKVDPSYPQAAVAADPKGIDGLWGPNTWKGVMVYQTMMGLKVDGKVGPITAASIREMEPLVADFLAAKGAKPVA